MYIADMCVMNYNPVTGW